MATPAEAWQQVGEQFDTLGTHLRTHFDEVTTQATAERAAFEKALRALLGALEKGFGTAGKAVRDPALREDINEVATSIREALLAIFETTGDQVREHVSAPIRTSKTKVAGAIKHAPAGTAVTKKKAATRKATAHKPSPRTTSATKSSK
jgi:hypothetical protein